MITVRGPLDTHQGWFERKHQAGLRKPSMETVFQLGSWDEPAEPRHSAPQETRQHGHGWSLSRQLTGSGLKQTDLTAVCVEQPQPLQALSR